MILNGAPRPPAKRPPSISCFTGSQVVAVQRFVCVSELLMRALTHIVPGACGAQVTVLLTEPERDNWQNYVSPTGSITARHFFGTEMPSFCALVISQRLPIRRRSLSAERLAKAHDLSRGTARDPYT